MKATGLGLLQEIALFFPAFLLVYTFSGFFKSLIASLNGDHTARKLGYMTLNPLMHVNLIGLLLLTSVFAAIFWIGPSFLIAFFILLILGIHWYNPVPIYLNRLRHRSLGIVTTFAGGAVGKVVLALLMLYIQKYTPFTKMPFYAAIPLMQMIRRTVEVSLLFALFDLIPLPPFDGGLIVLHLLPPSMNEFSQKLEQYAGFILLFIMIIPPIRYLLFGFIVVGSGIIEQALHYLVI